MKPESEEEKLKRKQWLEDKRQAEEKRRRAEEARAQELEARKRVRGVVPSCYHFLWRARLLACCAGAARSCAERPCARGLRCLQAEQEARGVFSVGKVSLHALEE